MKTPGIRNLSIVTALLFVGVFAFLAFIFLRARMWSPKWAVEPTTRVFETHPHRKPVSGKALQIYRGSLLFEEYQCSVCHGPMGKGGVKNPNADPDERVPNLLGLAEAFTWDDLEQKIMKGSEPYKLEEGGAAPPLRMPAFKKDIPKKDLDDLATFLFSLEFDEDGS